VIKSGVILVGFDEFSAKSEKKLQKVKENIWLAQRRKGAKRKRFFCHKLTPIGTKIAGLLRGCEIN